jgi:hypothetical protein
MKSNTIDESFENGAVKETHQLIEENGSPKFQQVNTVKKASQTSSVIYLLMNRLVL